MYQALLKFLKNAFFDGFIINSNSITAININRWDFSNTILNDDANYKYKCYIIKYVSSSVFLQL